MHANILRNLLKFNEVNLPNTYDRSSCIDKHLNDVSKYCRSCEYPDSEAADVLINSLADNEKFELFGTLEFIDNSKNVLWIQGKLRDLFGRTKLSQEEALLKLYRVRQEPEHSFRDFVSHLRIQGYKIFGDSLLPKKREEFLVTAFCNGLQDKDISVAVQKSSPDTLQNCLELAEKMSKTSNHANTDKVISQLSKSANSEISLLRAKINNLEAQMRFLMEKLERNNMNSSNGPEMRNREQLRNFNYKPEEDKQKWQTVNRSNSKRDVECYRCHLKGHIAKYCKTNLDEANERNTSTQAHRSRNIYQNQFQNQRHVRNIDRSDCHSDVFTSDADDEVDHNVQAISISRRTQRGWEAAQRTRRNEEKEQRKEGKKSRSYNRNGETEKEVGKLVSFVNDKNSFAVSKGDVSTGKPTVPCIISGQNHSFLLDTGAELNVIDTNLVNKLMNSGRDIRFKKTNYALRCANGSKFNAVGKVSMRITVGNYEMNAVLAVVDNLNSGIIIGMRQLKKDGVTIDSKNDSIIFEDGTIVEFEKPISAASVCSKND